MDLPHFLPSFNSSDFAFCLKALAGFSSTEQEKTVRKCSKKCTMATASGFRTVKIGKKSEQKISSISILFSPQFFFIFLISLQLLLLETGCETGFLRGSFIAFRNFPGLSSVKLNPDSESYPGYLAMIWDFLKSRITNPVRSAPYYMLLY